MNSILVIGFIFTIYSSMFHLSLSSVALLSAVHICAYSNDPEQYKPKCYDCREEVYTNALSACISATSMPKNITFKAASCMEGNCNIPYFTPTTPEVENLPPMWELLGRILLPNNNSPLFRAKRSVKDNSIDSTSSNPMRYNIIKRVETVVGKPEYSSPELEYEEM